MQHLLDSTVFADTFSGDSGLPEDIATWRLLHDRELSQELKRIARGVLVARRLNYGRVAPFEELLCHWEGLARRFVRARVTSSFIVLTISQIHLELPARVLAGHTGGARVLAELIDMEADFNLRQRMFDGRAFNIHDSTLISPLLVTYNRVRQLQMAEATGIDLTIGVRFLSFSLTGYSLI